MEVFYDLDDAVEHVRKCHHNIRRPAALGCYWYCFECDTEWKDHRSYGSSEAMLHILKIAMDVELSSVKLQGSISMMI